MCWSSRTTADIVAVPSPFVKNDGSASEHVRAELAFYRRTLTSLVRMDTEYQFGPLNYKDDEAEKEHLVTQGTCVLKAELWYSAHQPEKCRVEWKGTLVGHKIQPNSVVVISATHPQIDWEADALVSHRTVESGLTALTLTLQEETNFEENVARGLAAQLRQLSATCNGHCNVCWWGVGAHGR